MPTFRMSSALAEAVRPVLDLDVKSDQPHGRCAAIVLDALAAGAESVEIDVYCGSYIREALTEACRSELVAMTDSDDRAERIQAARTLATLAEAFADFDAGSETR